MSERSESWNCHSEARVQVLLSPLTGFVHGSPEFKSSTKKNSLPVCLRLVRILNSVMFDLNHLLILQSFARPR